MHLPRVLHLVDDTTPGGVMRVVTHLCRAPLLAADARHEMRMIPRHGGRFRHLDADILVSHLTVSWRGLPALFALRAQHPGIPVLHVEHSYTEAFTAANVPDRARFLILLRTAYSLFNRVIAVSHAQGRWLERRRLVLPDRLSVIQPTTDLAAFRDLPPLRHLPRRIGAIGRLHRQKGFDLLIAAFRLTGAADLRLDIFGDGPERDRLRDLAAPDSRITLHGPAPDPVAAIAAVDAIAMPSRWEAYGMVAAEALAARRPVLVSGVDGLADQIQTGAVRVPGFTPEAWARALADLSARPPVTPALTHLFLAPPEIRFVRGWRRLLKTVDRRLLVPLPAAPHDTGSSDGR